MDESLRKRLAGVCTACLTVLVAVGLAGCGEIRVPDPAVRYVAFGDSTTAGPAEGNYWEILRDDLGELSDSFAGEGQGGETTDEGLSRLQWLMDHGIYPNAEVLLYWEGAADVIEFIRTHDPFLLFSPDDPAYPFSTQLADALADIQANVESAVAIGRQAGLTVYVATYYFLRANVGECDAMPLNLLLPAQADHANVYVLMLNEKIRQVAANPGATLVDVETAAEAIRAVPDNYHDCRHLSEQGNEIVAGIFRTVIED